MPAGWTVERALLATVGDVLERDPAATVLLDVRRHSEHDGSFVHPCCARPGRIPGSNFLFWEDLLENSRYRPAHDIAARAIAAGISPDQEIITYCHRGARAATALYGLRRAGFPRGRIFVGSWHEWAERTDLPAETGMA
jgi:thiosulfate/3-mercaptopyruvate sulfurtransferase